jgi:hypothetical protein
MINSDEFSILNSTNSTNSYFNIVSNDQFNLNSTLKQQQQQQQQQQLQNQTYLQPIKIFQQQQSVPQQHYQIHQFKNGNINDEIISPLSNSSSTSSSSSMSSLSTSSISSLSSLCNTNTTNNNSNNYPTTVTTPTTTTNTTLNNFLSNETNSNNNINHCNNQKDKIKLKIKSLNDNYVSNKSNQKKLNNKKKTSQTSNDLDEERTSQLVSELLRNIKEKTKQLESLNQHMKSSNNDSKCNSKNHHDSISNSPAQSPSINNTSISFETMNKINTSTSATTTTNKKIRNKVKSSSKKALNQDLTTSTLNNKEKCIQIPNGWQRLVETNSYSIVYKSPSGVQFNSLDEIKSYLLEADTCKCGLECPLNIYETFNFDVTVKNLPSSSSLTDLSNKLITNCCFHKAKDSVRYSEILLTNHKRIIDDDLNSFKKNKITNENDSANTNNTNRLLSLDLLNECYQFSDDDVERNKLTLDSNEFNLIQLNNELDSNYLNSLNLNEDLDLIQLKANSSNQQVNNETNDLIINNDLLMSSSSISSSSLTNTPVILTSNLIMDFSATSNNNNNSKNIFNFYTPQEEKSIYYIFLKFKNNPNLLKFLFLDFDKAILRMISNDCNEINDSLELNVSLKVF